MIIRGRGAAVGDNLGENENHHVHGDNIAENDGGIIAENENNLGENENHHGDNIALLRTRTHTLSSHRGGSGEAALCRFCKLNLLINYILQFSVRNSGGFPAPQSEGLFSKNPKCGVVAIYPAQNDMVTF